MIKWVKLKKVAELTGYTVSALHHKIYKGHLVEDVHWRKGPDGILLMHTENFNAWLEGN